MERYGLGYLEDKFKKHGQEFEAMENRDEFNLPVALLSIVQEVIKLRKEVEELKGNE